MIDLTYSLIIEATEDPDFSGFIRKGLKVLREWVIPLRTAYTRRNGVCKNTSPF